MSNRPQISIQFRDKEANKTYEVGVIFWTNRDVGASLPAPRTRPGTSPRWL